MCIPLAHGNTSSWLLSRIFRGSLRHHSSKSAVRLDVITLDSRLTGPGDTSRGWDVGNRSLELLLLFGFRDSTTAFSLREDILLGISSQVFLEEFVIIGKRLLVRMVLRKKFGESYEFVN